MIGLPSGVFNARTICVEAYFFPVHSNSWVRVVCVCHTQADGERLPLAVKDLGSCDMYPSSLVHSPNGRFVAVCGDGEYIIYTALAWRNKSYGSALSFVWGEDSNVFATRESGSSVRIFKNFKETAQVKPGFNVEEIYGGTLLGIRSADFICFHDWGSGQVLESPLLCFCWRCCCISRLYLHGRIVILH